MLLPLLLLLLLLLWAPPPSRAGKGVGAPGAPAGLHDRSRAGRGCHPGAGLFRAARRFPLGCGMHGPRLRMPSAGGRGEGDAPAQCPARQARRPGGAVAGAAEGCERDQPDSCPEAGKLLS